MRNLTTGLLASVAALALTSGAALAQSNNNGGLLGDTLNDVTGTVSGTVDNVTGTVTDTVDNTVGNIGSANAVSDTVGGVTGNQGDASVGDVGSVGDIGSFDTILNSIGNGDISDISDVANVSDIQVVDVSDLANFDADLLNNTLNGTQLTALHDAINGNDVLSNALSGNAVDVTDVVAVDNHQDGTLIIYTYES